MDEVKYAPKIEVFYRDTPLLYEVDGGGAMIYTYPLPEVDHLEREQTDIGYVFDPNINLPVMLNSIRLATGRYPSITAEIFNGFSGAKEGVVERYYNLQLPFERPQDYINGLENLSGRRPSLLFRLFRELGGYNGILVTGTSDQIHVVVNPYHTLSPEITSLKGSEDIVSKHFMTAIGYAFAILEHEERTGYTRYTKREKMEDRFEMFLAMGFALGSEELMTRVMNRRDLLALSLKLGTFGGLSALFGYVDKYLTTSSASVNREVSDIYKEILNNVSYVMFPLRT